MNATLKVIGAGFGRTGTLSLKLALEQLGFSPCHNAEVRRRIEPDRLLVYEVAQGWEPLCRFLDVPIPPTPMPETNSTEEFRRNREAQRE